MEQFLSFQVLVDGNIADVGLRLWHVFRDVSARSPVYFVNFDPVIIVLLLLLI